MSEIINQPSFCSFKAFSLPLLITFVCACNSHSHPPIAAIIIISIIIIILNACNGGCPHRNTHIGHFNRTASDHVPNGIMAYAFHWFFAVSTIGHDPVVITNFSLLCTAVDSRTTNPFFFESDEILQRSAHQRPLTISAVGPR